MKIEMLDDGLLLVAETDFEEATLKTMFPVGEDFNAYLKTATSANEIVGLRINGVPIPTIHNKGK